MRLVRDYICCPVFGKHSIQSRIKALLFFWRTVFLLQLNNDQKLLHVSTFRQLQQLIMPSCSIYLGGFLVVSLLQISPSECECSGMSTPQGAGSDASTFPPLDPSFYHKLTCVLVQLVQCLKAGIFHSEFTCHTGFAVACLGCAFPLL